MTRESYAAEQAAQRARVETFAAGVAAELDGWEARPTSYDGWELVNGDGVCVWLSLITYGAGAGRITVSAGVPREADYSSGDYSGLDRPEITVSPDRPAATVAKDVARRLLPGAVDYWGTVSGRMARRIERANTVETLTRELAEIMGGRAEERRNGWQASMPERFRHRGIYTYGELVPDSDARVDVSIHNLTMDEARELAAMIAGWQ